MIPGQAAVATISPLCSRWPLIRADLSIRVRVWGDHLPPVEVGTPRAIKSAAIERTGSPASSRFAHSTTIAASAGRTVSLSSSYPYGRLPPPETLPLAAISSCLRRIRRLLSSLSFLATAPRIRAWNCPSEVVRSMSPLTDATFDKRKRAHKSMNASSSLG
jgi:hypothetical protein